jgi:hypothetical protein
LQRVKAEVPSMRSRLMPPEVRHQIPDDLKDPALDHLATIVRGPDTSRQDLSPQCGGLFAISLGLSANFPDDHEMLKHGMVVYDALWGPEGVAEKPGAALCKPRRTIGPLPRRVRTPRTAIPLAKGILRLNASTAIDHGCFVRRLPTCLIIGSPRRGAKTCLN